MASPVGEGAKADGKGNLLQCWLDPEEEIKPFNTLFLLHFKSVLFSNRRDEDEDLGL